MYTKFIYYFSVLCMLGGFTFGQSNSVQLKDGNGNLVSSHQSITAAYSAIPAVITQAYIIEILSEYTAVSETFPIQITAKSGSSAQNTITLRPASGNNGEVISRALNNNPIINLDGVKYFILDGRPGGIGDSANLTIENTLNVGAKTNTINFIDGASNNVVKYVNAKSIPRSNAGPRNIYFSSSSAGNTINNVIEFCNISGGRAGVSFGGISSGLNSGNIIRNCKVYNFGLTGFWLVSSAENTTIQGCEIYQEQSGLNTSIVGGIFLNPSGSRGTTEIINNKIYNLRHNSFLDSAAVLGIIGSGDNGSTINIINNFIALPHDNQNTNSTHGIFLKDSTQFTSNIYFNTVRVGGVQAGSITELQIISSAFTKANTNPASVFNVINNIFTNHRTGGFGLHVAGNVQNTAGILNFNYNCYYTENIEPGYHVVWGSLLFESVTDYRTAVFPNEQNTIFKNIEFVSNIDLHISGNSVGDLDLAGMPIAVTYDIDNEFRDANYPYKGADESDALPVELSFFTSSISGNNVTLSWITKTETNNSGFEIQRKSNSSGWNTVAFISGNGTSTNENMYTYTDKNLNAGVYNYRLKQVDFGGAHTYYNLSEEVTILNPSAYLLSQNYPNPFNPSTSIEYTLPEEGFVNITVYTITGEVITNLVNTVQTAGSYKLNFDASSLGSGTYFYTLKVNDFTSTKKMILLR